jgi:hypothetical protein
VLDAEVAGQATGTGRRLQDAVGDLLVVALFEGGLGHVSSVFGLGSDG